MTSIQHTFFPLLRFRFTYLHIFTTLFLLYVYSTNQRNLVNKCWHQLISYNIEIAKRDRCYHVHSIDSRSFRTFEKRRLQEVLGKFASSRPSSWLRGSCIIHGITVAVCTRTPSTGEHPRGISMLTDARLVSGNCQTSSSSFFDFFSFSLSFFFFIFGCAYSVCSFFLLLSILSGRLFDVPIKYPSPRLPLHFIYLRLMCR